ncbi:MAG: hypothetical protein ACRDPF_23245, partial [Streptosporangiaceae bacterium]
MTSPHPTELQPVHGAIPATAPSAAGPGRTPARGCPAAVRGCPAAVRGFARPGRADSRVAAACSAARSAALA